MKFIIVMLLRLYCVLFVFITAVGIGSPSSQMNLQEIKHKIYKTARPLPVPNYDFSMLPMRQTMNEVKPLVETEKSSSMQVESDRKQNDETMQSLLIHLQYADGTQLMKQLTNKSASLLSKSGRVLFDSRTNSLWVHDSALPIHQLQQWLRTIDKPVSQVLIKTRIVNIDESQLKTLGIHFDTSTSTSSNHEAEINESEIPGLVIPVARLPNETSLDLKLSALVRHGMAKIVSNPQIMTMNHHKAMIESGEDVPYQEQTPTGATSVAFKKAVMRLSVEPEILPKRRVRLALEINQDKISALFVNGVPAIRTQHLVTKAMVRDGETLVMGGIHEQLEHQQNEGVRGLQKIPILGHLFRRHNQDSENRQLLVFVTPEILGDH